jgi:methylated-DNA-protein-cysteine methyltransferase-like protein
VTTYGDVAAALGSPRVARHVGWALAALREEDVPWHRVINSRGRISFKGDTPRAVLQRAKLEAEGVTFSATGRVDLKLLRWTFAV